MNAVSIKPLTRGYLVTGYGPDGIDETYAEDSAAAALHRACRLLGVEPATAYLPPATEALIERAEAVEADLPEDMGLTAGGAYRCANEVGVGD